MSHVRPAGSGAPLLGSGALRSAPRNLLRWVRPLLLSSACGVAVLVVWWFFVLTLRGQLIDGLAYEGANIGAWRVTSQFERILQIVSVEGVALAMGAVALTAILRRRLGLAVEAAIVIAGANLSTRVLKFHLLWRPDLMEGPLTSNSYPSGHTTAAASAMVAALLVAPRRLRALIAALGAVVMLVFGYGTFVARWHRPSDVVGAYLVCFCWAIMALCVNGLRQWLVPGTVGREAGTTVREPRATAALLVTLGAFALAVAAWCGLLTWPVGTVWQATRQQSFIAYLGGSAGIAGVASCGMGILLHLVQRHDVERPPR